MLVVTGIDTDIGKTIICSWLCVHTQWAYWKPIQTGAVQGDSASDSFQVKSLSHVEILPEQYIYKTACSPHEASHLEGKEIDCQAIHIPQQLTIIEGIGGVCVPLTMRTLFIDILASWTIPTLVVSSSRLGAINHTLLTLEALQHRDIPVLGIILNGGYNVHTHKAIEYYTQTPILGYFPPLPSVTNEILQSIALPQAIEDYVQMKEQDINNS